VSPAPLEELMPSIDYIDMRLLVVGFELSDLHYYLDLLEKQIKEKQTEYRSDLQRIIKEQGLTPDDSNWQIVHEYEGLADYRMPRFFRAPFLISLYAVYESAVTEIAKLIQKQKRIEITIDEKGTFTLDKAKGYYNKIIGFPLYSDNVAWERIKMLSIIRHAIAHANGRLEMIKPKIRNNLQRWEKENIGISSSDGFIVIEECFLRDTLGLVSASLNDLFERYKEWDDRQTSQ
jgi:hypothetical protein